MQWIKTKEQFIDYMALVLLENQGVTDDQEVERLLSGEIQQLQETLDRIGLSDC